MSYPCSSWISSRSPDNPTVNRDLHGELNELIGIFRAQGREKMALRLEKILASGNPYSMRFHIWLYKKFTAID